MDSVEPSPGITLSVESLQEFQVQEIGFDGHETYAKPLSMSENLAKLAHKIDFSEDQEVAKADDKPRSSVQEREEKDSKDGPSTSFQNQQKPWESVKTKLRDALTEVSVLYDVVNIARMNREPPYQYLVLEKVSGEASSATANEVAVKIQEKKKSLELAAKILTTGAARMRYSLSSDKKALAEQRNFHNELLFLRQNWRLKRVGNNILGDLSFRTSGSRFWHTGTFEVTKTSEEEFEEAERRGVQPCSLKVTVPSDLEGTSYIRVLIQEGEAEIASAYLVQSSRAQISSDAHWQQRLEAAQNVLFCKELFAQMAREAVQLKAPIPHIVVGNQIISSIIPGVQLVIRLCHDSNMNSTNVSAAPEKNAHQNIDLEQSLHQLLRELHHSNLSGPTPTPVTASFNYNNKKRRLAGPLALDRREIAEIQQTECVLEKILKQSRHIVLRDRTAKVLNDMAASIQDPLIMVHWSVLQQPLQATVKVFISSPGYEHFARTSMQLMIGYEDIKAILKDGRTVNLTYQERDLKNLLTCQISEHRVNAVYDLAKSLRMQIIHYNFFVGVGPPPKLGNVSAVVVATPNGRRTIALRSDPVDGPKVMIQDESNTREKSDVVTDPKWEVFPSGFKEVDLSKIRARNFVHKMELLMGNLSH